MSRFELPRAARTARVVLLALVAVSLWAPNVFAQRTSSDVRGTVVTEEGDPIRGASVQILHVPSGTVSESVTSETGGFFESGLRVGGPYQITVTANDFQGIQREGVFLQPGSQNPFRFQLREISAELDAISVTGAAISDAEILNNGVGSSYTARDIANQPTIDRDVIQTLLRDPLAQGDGVGNLTVGGVNARFNSLSIDGSLQTDDFGLVDDNREDTYTSYATVRSPINLDAIESATLAFSDYSVAVSGASGAAINVVTKSGTNEFDGSIYYAYKDDSFVGEEFDGGEFDPGTFEEEEYGFTLGGPIIKDRLFFFVSYDEYENAPTVEFIDDDERNGVDPAFFDEIRDIIRNVYGFDPGGRPQVLNLPTTSERLLAKVDWNINLDHRASLTYQSTEESDIGNVGSSTFQSAWYDTGVELEAWSAQLNSDWTPRFSTELRFNYKENSRPQVCRAGRGVGQIDLDFGPDSIAGTPLDGLLTEDEFFIAGCDRFRHANEFDDERTQLFALGEYFLGDHVVSFGMEYQNYAARNLFIDTSLGRFEFETLEELQNRRAAQVRYQNVPSNNPLDGVAEWEYDQWSFFVGDSWAITPEFSLDYGIRYEVFDQSDKPAFSQAVLNDTGLRTDNNIDGNDLLMPRVSFLWTPLNKTTISGGVGLFPNSAPPLVWISNAFNFPTVEPRAFDVEGVDLSTIPQELLDAVASGTPIPRDLIGPDFETPSDWKASLRLEQVFDMAVGDLDFGRNYVATAQLVYTRARDGFDWELSGQTRNPAALPIGVAPDGRPIYADLDDLDLPNLTTLRNNDGAESTVLSLALAKQYDSGASFNISYAYTDAEVVSEGTSSRGVSNWRGQIAIDRNNPDPRTSPFEIEHSFKFNVAFERNLIADLQSRVDVFGRLFKGDVWSTSFDTGFNESLFGQANGEGPFGNAPLYIPSPGSDPRVVYGSDFDVEGFFGFVEENGIPVGRIHEPLSEQVDDWNNIWDLRFQQELPGLPGIGRFVGDNNFKLILDIANFPNLINSDWGKVTDGTRFGTLDIVQADLVSAADVAANGVDAATALNGDAARTTCLSASACLYRFNEFDDSRTQFTDRDDSVYEIRLTLRYDF
jgi:hypothetical protein